MNQWKFYLLEKLANQSLFNESKSNFLLIKWETSMQKEAYGQWKRWVLNGNILQNV